MSVFRLNIVNIENSILKKRKDSYIIEKSWITMVCERIKMRIYSKFLTAVLILVTFMTFAFVGCGQEEVIPVTEPTLEVTGDGELIAYMVEDFDKDYYVLSELDTMVREEISEFVKAGGYVDQDGNEGVTVESVAMAQDGSSQVVVALKFANSEIYGDYFDVEAFYGTVADAMTAGYDLSAALTGVKDGELFTQEQAEKNRKKHILIIEDSVIVRCSKKVLYIGTNTSLTEEGFVDCTRSEGLKLIITK